MSSTDVSNPFLDFVKPKDGVLKWGICSSGKIANDYCKALKIFPKSEHTITAVGARNIQHARSFAKKFDIPNAYGSYEDLANDSSYDVVYIGTINSQHLPLAMMFIERRRHVLCEKPLCLNAKQTRALIEFARKKNVFLMEGILSRFTPVHKKLEEEISRGTIGKVRVVQINFGIDSAPVEEKRDHRLLSSEGGGATLDLGIYAIQGTLKAFGHGPPERIIAAGHLFETGVDTSISVTFLYGDGGIGQIMCHVNAKLDNRMVVTGSKGSLVVEAPFHSPTQLITPEKTWTFPIPEADPSDEAGSKTSYNFIHSGNFVHQARAVREAILAGDIECATVSHKDSIIFAVIMDDIRRQLGVKFEVDDD